MKVEIHVEELVLHGVPASQRHAVGEAMEQELARLFTERGVPEGLTAHGLTARPVVGHVDAGELTFHSGRPLRDLGAAVARSVYGRFES